MSLEDVDLAVVSPCPSCGVPVRRFANVAIAGTALDPVRSGPWTCDSCLRAKVVEAAKDLHT